MARVAQPSTLAFLLSLVVAGGLLGGLVGSGARAEEEGPESDARTVVPGDLVSVDDGDSLAILWPEGAEVVRILGIDTPEVLHIDHDIPYAQPFGEEARGFFRGCLAMTERIEIRRAPAKDRYGRTLAYVFLDGNNYSVLAIRARQAEESISHYGDGGFPAEAAACLAAAKTAGPVPFESPHRYRTRMREVSAWMKKQGIYPRAEREE